MNPSKGRNPAIGIVFPIDEFVSRFIRPYLEAMESAEFIPKDMGERWLLMDVFLLDRFIYLRDWRGQSGKA